MAVNVLIEHVETLYLFVRYCKFVPMLRAVG